MPKSDSFLYEIRINPTTNRFRFSIYRDGVYFTGTSILWIAKLKIWHATRVQNNVDNYNQKRHDA